MFFALKYLKLHIKTIHFVNFEIETVETQSTWTKYKQNFEKYPFIWTWNEDRLFK